MFREMRRIKQKLPKAECEEVLRRGSSGVLALCGDDGYPYAVPLNYVYCGDRILFHCAKSGHKIDALKSNNKASFCVVDADEVVPSEYLTLYRSVIVFGKIHIIEDVSEKRAAIERFALRFSPCESEADRAAEIDRSWNGLCMLELEMEHISGKEARDLAKKRKSGR